MALVRDSLGRSRLPRPTIRECPATFAQANGQPCDRRWDDLSEVPESLKIRHCDHCQSRVYWVETSSELSEAIAAGHCVAIGQFDEKQGNEEFLGGLHFERYPPLDWD